jgi:hypothetical protein
VLPSARVMSGVCLAVVVGGSAFALLAPPSPFAIPACYSEDRRERAAADFYAKAVAALPEGATDVRCERKVDGLTGWLSFTLAAGGKPVRYLVHYYSFGPDSVRFEIVRAD